MTIEKEINDCITKWAQEHNVDCHSLHIFGSLLYLNGARFGSSSDIDMIVTIDRHMEKARFGNPNHTGTCKSNAERTCS